MKKNLVNILSITKVTEEFGGISMFRPSLLSEDLLHSEAEANLRHKYNIGKYTDRDTINKILKHQFSFFHELCLKLLPKISTLNFLMFLLNEYDKSCQIDNLYKNNLLSHKEATTWGIIGKRARRSIKYLVEQLVAIYPTEHLKDLSTQEVQEITEQIWIGSEELVELYMLSDQTFMLFPDDTILEIHPQGSQEYLTLDVNNSLVKQFEKRVLTDTMFRQDFAELDNYKSLLDNSFKETIGIEYSKAIKILDVLIKDSDPPTSGFPIPLLPRQTMIKALAAYFEVKDTIIEVVIDGFLLNKQKLLLDTNKRLDSKRKYKPLARGFFEISTPEGNHIIFSKFMAKECLVQLDTGINFKRMPLEWSNDKTNKALQNVSQQVGKQFEQIVFEQFQKIGFQGLKSVKHLKNKSDHTNQLKIPSDIGEIDYLGFCPQNNILILCECKMVAGSMEPKSYRDDLDEFVNSKKSYFKKFRKKIDWVCENRTNICTVLDFDSKGLEEPKVATIMIILYPSIVSCFATDFPCVTITEFDVEYRKNQSWPYTYGVY